MFKRFDQLIDAVREIARAEHVRNDILEEFERKRDDQCAHDLQSREALSAKVAAFVDHAEGRLTVLETEFRLHEKKLRHTRRKQLPLPVEKQDAKGGE